MSWLDKLQQAYYVVEVYCDDCRDGDYGGCFDGDSAYLGEDDEAVEIYVTRRNAKMFTSREEAEDRGWHATGDVGPWNFKVHRHFRLKYPLTKR